MNKEIKGTRMSRFLMGMLIYALAFLAVLAAGTIIVFNILYNIASKLIEENKNKS